MLPYFGCAQETDQTAPSWLEGRVLVCGGLGEGWNKPLESFGQSMGFAFDFKDLDCAI